MTLDESSFQFVRKFLLDRAAIWLDNDKQYLVKGRLGEMAQRWGMASVNELVRQLRRKPDGRLADEVVDALTTNETTFFRDEAPFVTLREIVLPELFRARRAMRRLTIWSGACSTGQEPYSVAMLLREHFTGYLEDWSIRIIGSDLSHHALARAIAGRYSRLEIERGLPAALRQRYFRQEGRHWQIRNEVRRMVEFRQMNLADNWPPMPLMDVILLRNVMVYFLDTTKQQILHRVRRQLRPDGYLFLGGAETTLLLDPAFRRQEHAGFSYYRLHPLPLSRSS